MNEQLLKTLAADILFSRKKLRKPYGGWRPPPLYVWGLNNIDWSFGVSLWSVVRLVFVNFAKEKAMYDTVR